MKKGVLMKQNRLSNEETVVLMKKAVVLMKITCVAMKIGVPKIEKALFLIKLQVS